MMTPQTIFDYVPEPVVLGLLGGMVVLILIALCYGLSPYRRVARFVRHADSSGAAEQSEGNQGFPGISLVVHSFGDREVLTGFLERVLRQDYPDFEIIVVNDASASATAMLAEQFAGNDKIYFTFIPPGSQVLSRHKLALTIGIKGAKKEVILTTTDHARPLSERWLREMAVPFMMSNKCGAVLGTAMPDFRALPCKDRMWARLFYSLRTARWIDSALDGRPWRGNGFNLAFRRELFFDNKGYSRGILLEGGDDDLFIETLSATHSISVAASRSARVVMEWGSATKRLCRNILRRRHDSEKELAYRAPEYMRRVQIFNLLALMSGCAAIIVQPILTTIIAVSLMAVIAITVEWVTLRRLTLCLTSERRSDGSNSSDSSDGSDGSDGSDRSDGSDTSPAPPADSIPNS